MRARQMMAIVALGLAVTGFGTLHMRNSSPQEMPMAAEVTWHWISPPQRLGASGPLQPLIDDLASWL